MLNNTSCYTLFVSAANLAFITANITLRPLLFQYFPDLGAYTESGILNLKTHTLKFSVLTVTLFISKQANVITVHS